MTIRIGIADIPLSSKNNNITSGIERMKELDLNHIEISFVKKIYINKTKAENISQIAKKFGITLTCHAPYYIDLASEDTSILENSKNTLILNIEIANVLGANIVVIHPGLYSERNPSDVYRLIEKNLRDITDNYANDVKIGVETTGRQKSFGTVDEILKLCQNNEKLCPVIDFGHIHAFTDGGLKTKEDFKNVLDQFSKFKTLHIHMSCVTYTEGNEKQHTPIASKEPNFKYLAELLKNDTREIIIICESPNREYDATDFKKWL
ncbi:MAG: TIM barrel protein [DPANN group archaeon]|nr:TIM barrel protein [DPANN group archaeon]